VSRVEDSFLLALATETVLGRWDFSFSLLDGVHTVISYSARRHSSCRCKQLSDLTGSVQIRLPHLQAGLRAAGLDVDADEVECLLANLVFRKMIRGYISHKPPVLVLAKAGAFKPLPEVLAATGPAGAGAGAADP